MKKISLFAVTLILVASAIVYNQTVAKDLFGSTAKVQKRIANTNNYTGYYAHLRKCEKYSAKGNDEVIGPKGNVCVTKVTGSTCEFPMSVAKEIGDNYYNSYTKGVNLPEGYGCNMNIYHLKYCNPPQGIIQSRCKIVFEKVLGKTKSDKIFYMLNAKDSNGYLKYSMADIRQEMRR